MTLPPTKDAPTFCGCGASYTPTPDGIRTHQQTHGHRPSPVRSTPSTVATRLAAIEEMAR